MKKILSIAGIYPLAFLIGAMFGMMVTFILMKTLIESHNEAYDNGYKQAQQECINLIKSTK